MPHASGKKAADLLQWRDVLGRVHNLATARTVSLAVAAKRLRLSPVAVRRKIDAGMLFPVVQNGRAVRLYEVALDDYVIRTLLHAYGPRDIRRP